MLRNFGKALRQAQISSLAKLSNEQFIRSISSSNALGQSDEIKHQCREFQVHGDIPSPDIDVSSSKDELFRLYKDMYLMRRMEITAGNMYQNRQIRGFCHLYDGQEAVCVGATASLQAQDSLVTSYRDHCWYVSRGGHPHEVFAELMGKATGGSMGVGGSMHFYSKKNNFYGGHGIVGAQVPIGIGLGFAHKYNNDGNCAITAYGDGASNQGQVAESINLAALWKLPVIFVIENNHFGMGTSIARASSNIEFFRRGFTVPGIKVDGMDVLAVKSAFAFAKKFVLENGPICLEMDTYRFHGHSMSDPDKTYRSRSDVDAVKKQRDPIDKVKTLLLQSKMIDEKEIREIEVSLKKQIDTARQQAESDPEPDKSWMWANLYVKPIGVVKGVTKDVQTTPIYRPKQES